MSNESERPRVSISTGALAGVSTGAVSAFLGVPYAAPPVGERRFLPPAPAVPWSGVRDASTHGAAPPQGVPTPGRMVVDLSVDAEDEDCLTLSVWSPDISPDGDLPVMVWIHGGAFVAGGTSVPAYDGSRLAAQGVVVVSLNYRLGMLGWLRCPELGATGNQGLADQLAALYWVQGEISRFGGDPGNVTVFGESAGAGSIAALLSGPGELPVSKAILQSGSHHLCRSPEAADAVCARVAEEVGGDLASLRSLPLDEIRRIQEVAAPRSAGVLFGPVTDGELVAEYPEYAIRGGAAGGVQLLVGTNLDEMGFFWGRDERFDEISDEHLAGMLRRWTERPDEVLAAYVEARTARGDALDTRAVACAMGSDWTFRAPAMRFVDWHAPQGDVWAYLFDWKSPLFDGL
ncbi:MAG: carboxylesterase family protein, partial [Actinomycetota bacterium]|nr:carboxylesterase family protein [Actinomycetota bacterium]